MTVASACGDGVSLDEDGRACPGCISAAAHPPLDLPKGVPRAPGELATYPFFPQGGALAGDLLISNYTDRLAGTAIGDFDGGTITYNGHRGIDCNILTWEQQDAGVPVFAALDGIVIDAHDGEFDRNTEWAGQPANYVVLWHGGTHLTYYYHLKKNSVAVVLDQEVSAGQQLGLTGSSGISSAPHLHFQTEVDGVAIEPFSGTARPGASLWQFQEPVVSDYYVREFNISAITFGSAGWAGLPEPPPNTGTFVASDTAQSLYFWWYQINRPAGVSYALALRRPDGTVATTATGTWQTAGYRGWQWRSRTIVVNQIGEWHAELSVGGELQFAAPFTVVASASEIANRAPFDAEFAFKKHPITEHDVPVCQVADYTVVDDPDYDLVRYRYVWKVNGVTVRDVTTGAKSDALARDLIARDDSLRCEVTPTDTLASAATSVVETIVSETFTDWSNRLGQAVDPALNLDGDAFPNLIEYALGRSPNSFDAVPPVDAGSIPAVWNPGFAPAPPWAEVSVFYSTDLSSWLAASKAAVGEGWIAPAANDGAYFRVTGEALPEPPLSVPPSQVGTATP